MEFLPVFLRLTSQCVLVVGGGGVAARKASLLIKAGACVRVVAPAIGDELRELVRSHGGEIRQREYLLNDLEGVAAAVAATDDARINAQLSEDAKGRHLPVNVVDSPALSTFIFPSIIDRSPLLVAVSSAGQSPVLARLLRAKLESTIPAAYGRLAWLAGELRDQVKAQLSNVTQRRQFWERHLSGRFAELVFSGQEQEARDLAMQDLAESRYHAGEVYLIGAGPGDPDLLTFKALRLMQQADVIVYDRLVSEPIRDLCRRDAERIYVGKARADHVVPQEDINALLVQLAAAGKRVCRLKGGDPFIFGRGGEEIQELCEAGIPFQVVPGITAASGCSAYAGIPLTHRDYAQSVRFVTGHLRDGAVELPWSELIHERQTLVLYMALVGLKDICQRLIEHGMRRDMPVALVSHGTTPDQKVVVGSVSTIADDVAVAGLRAPTLTIIGDVVKLRDKLKWFS